MSPDEARTSLRELLDLKAEQTLADNWQRHYDQLNAPKQAWADLLMQKPWHWFLTLTFKPEKCGPRAGVHPETADKAYRLLVSSINRDLYGPRWHKKPHSGLVWARGQELHRDGRIHFHALASAPGADLNQLARRLDWMDWWYERFGIARIERPLDQDDVCSYVSKYVVKGGEVDFSNNFGRVNPPRLNYVQVMGVQQKMSFTGQESGPDQRRKTDRTC